MNNYCKYGYSDIETHTEFPCKEEIHDNNSDFCIFHDIDYLNTPNQNQRLERANNLLRIIRKKINNTNFHLRLEGYYLPSLDLSRMSIKNVSFSYSTFLGIINFSNSKLVNVSFQGAKFIGKSINFMNSKFNGEKTNFAGAIFKAEELDFSGAKFNGTNVNFKDSKFFVVKTNFAGAIFKAEELDFSGAKFNGTIANFKETIFEATNSLFHKSVFSSKSTYFWDAQFKGYSIQFWKTEFSGDSVSFEKALFYNSIVSYAEAIFKDAITVFKDAKFKRGITSFEGAQFEGDSTSFEGAQFEGDSTSFEGAQFEGDSTSFEGATFRYISNFSNSVLTNIIMKDTAFRGPSFFRKTRFNELIQDAVYFDTNDLSNVSFIDTDITRIKFKETATWGDLKKIDDNKIFDERLLEALLNNMDIIQELYNFLTSETYIIDLNDDGCKKNVLNFLASIFEEHQYSRLDIDRLNLKKTEDNNLLIEIKDTPGFSISFDSLQIKKSLRISNQHIFDFIVFGNNMRILYPNISDIKSVYRHLRENNDFNSRYQESGKFFVREKELDRLYSQKIKLKLRREENRIIRDSFLEIRKNNVTKYMSYSTFYYVVSKYGESAILPLIWIGILLISSSFLRTLVDIITSNPNDSLGYSIVLSNIIYQTLKGIELFPENIGYLLFALDDVLGRFVQIWYTKIGFTLDSLIPAVKINAGFNWIDFVTGIFGGIFIGNLIIALKRKFERTLRH